MKRKLEQQIESYLDYCQNVRRMTKASIETRTWTLHNFLKMNPRLKKVEDITTQTLIDYASSFSKRRRSGKTINSRMSELIPFIRYYQEMGVATPKLNLHLVQKAKEDPPRRNHFTRQQIEQALEFANLQQWLFIKLAYDCGLRLSELTNLRLKEINGQVIRVVGKGKKLGEMRMSPETRARLDAWIRRNCIVDYLWPSSRCKGKPLRRGTVYKRMKEPFELAGIEGFYPHALRHSFATDKQKKGASPFEIQIMLRHSSVNTSMRYLHGFEGSVQDVFRKYEGNAPISNEDKGDIKDRLLNTAKELASSGTPKNLQNAAMIYELLAKL